MSESCSVEQAVDVILAHCGNDIRIGLPLGLGKPNQLLNALYQRVKAEPQRKLCIFTALSLASPPLGEGLQKALLGPFFARHFADYEEPAYLQDLRENSIPSHITVKEFFFLSGSMLHNNYAQQQYTSANYTHVTRDLKAAGINVLMQMVACDAHYPEQLSLSCNPELTLELLPYVAQRRAAGEAIVCVAQVHHQLPFMPHDAVVNSDFFDAIIDSSDCQQRLFATPQQSISDADYAIGFLASALVHDGGTLQIGIGSLGDAITHALLLRDNNNAAYQQRLTAFIDGTESVELIDKEGGLEPFKEGLYGCSEMFVDGFYRLMDAGILRRKVWQQLALQRLVNQDPGIISRSLRKEDLDNFAALIPAGHSLSRDEVNVLREAGFLSENIVWQSGRLHCKQSQQSFCSSFNSDQMEALAACGLGEKIRGGIFMHGGFFLGSADFYAYLRQLNDGLRNGINMTAINYMNDLYHQTDLKTAQRQYARFINTAFTLTLGGSIVSDGIADAKVISGVGGQYNFVSQGHEIPGGRSIILCRATRTTAKGVSSNIVMNFPHVTIPRHLRDIFITEYGIADTRGKSDNEVMKALINIADSRFQEDLLGEAKRAGKIEADYCIPKLHQNNCPQRIRQQLNSSSDCLENFPFGSELDACELRIAKALKWLAVQANNKPRLFMQLLLGFKAGRPARFADELQRMQLQGKLSLAERLQRQLLLYALVKTAA